MVGRRAGAGGCGDVEGGSDEEDVVEVGVTVGWSGSKKRMSRRTRFDIDGRKTWALTLTTRSTTPW